ncbi:MAG: DinB family protein [Bacteroidota bacterium]|nr:DinB family protein [Bacteroidota bacterium]
MEKYIDNIRQMNNTFVQLLDSLSIEQLNKIPDGFKNNIIWNFAHLLAIQQSIFYRLSSLQPKVDEAFINSYKRGTQPNHYVDETEVNRIKNVFSNAINTFEDDYKNGLFKEFKTYPTSMGVVLTSIDDAIQFSTVHDGLHLGYARALRRLV